MLQTLFFKSGAVKLILLASICLFSLSSVQAAERAFPWFPKSPVHNGGKISYEPGMVICENMNDACVVMYNSMVQGQYHASGSYISAATQALGVRNMCVEPDSEWYFHSAVNLNTTQMSSTGNAMLRKNYPRRVRNYLDSLGALGSTEFTKLTGSELIALGVARCKDGDVAAN